MLYCIQNESKDGVNVGYLEQFARNKRSKEKSEVLTARLPHSLYNDFKTYCDELGLSISEAVCLLVEREVSSVKPLENTAMNEISTTLERNVNTSSNTDNSEVVVKPNTKVNTVKKTSTTKPTTNESKRFTTNPWKVNDKLPCPICEKWYAATNFSRHAKDHGTTTEQLLTDEQYKDKVNSMVAEQTEGS